jgi:hypothetical protein
MVQALSSRASTSKVRLPALSPLVGSQNGLRLSSQDWRSRASSVLERPRSKAHGERAAPRFTTCVPRALTHRFAGFLGSRGAAMPLLGTAAAQFVPFVRWLRAKPATLGHQWEAPAGTRAGRGTRRPGVTRKTAARRRPPEERQRATSAHDPAGQRFARRRIGVDGSAWADRPGESRLGDFERLAGSSHRTRDAEGVEVVAARRANGTPYEGSNEERTNTPSQQQRREHEASGYLVDPLRPCRGGVAWKNPPNFGVFCHLAWGLRLALLASRWNRCRQPWPRPNARSTTARSPWIAVRCR